MSSIKKMRESNEQRFFDDLKMVYEFMVYCHRTNGFFKIRKSEVLKTAETSEIRYYITDKIFVSRRNVMVII